MLFTQYYLDCLSQASYLVGDESTGRAVVVDPRRDIDEYLADAEAEGLSVAGVINTGFHDEIISGHRELAARCGAWIGYGRRATGVGFPFHALADGDRIVLGDVVLRILETPGRTPESISIVVYEHAEDNVPYGVLTGDALFIGDVGRPEVTPSSGVTANDLARMLYHSVHDKLMALPDAVRLFPAHSACGKRLSGERQSTIGAQRRTNYACAPMGEDEFVALVTEGQPAAPFDPDAQVKRHQVPEVTGVPEAPEVPEVTEVTEVTAHVRPLTMAQFLAIRADDAIVLDTRDQQAFAAGHVRGSLNVPADKRFAERVGLVVEPDRRILVVAPRGRETEVVMRLARVGFENVTGYLHEPEAAFLDIPGEVVPANRLTASELRAALADWQAPDLLDVRSPAEIAAGAIEGAQHIPLAELSGRLGEVPETAVVVYCAAGSRSSIAASMLRAAGRLDVSDLMGGYQAWKRLPAAS